MELQHLHGDNTYISECYNLGKITNSAICNKYQGVGGIVGIAFNETTTIAINQCYNKGSVNGIDTGGIVAWCEYIITIEDCYNTGTIKGTTFTGGILGWTGQR